MAGERARLRQQGAGFARGPRRAEQISLAVGAAVGAKVLTESGHEGKAYELTGPVALTYGQIAESLTAALGRPIRYVPISHAQYKQAAMSAGTPEGYADALVELSRYYEEGHAARVSPAVRQLTGRDPIPFAQFARDYADKLR